MIGSAPMFRSIDWRDALPFWVSLAVVPLVAIGAARGGWWIALIPAYAWFGFWAFDAVTGRDTTNADPDTPADRLALHKLLTMVWAPVQIGAVFVTLAYAAQSPHLGTSEHLALAFALGIVAGTIGIVYAHELMHRQSPVERWLGDSLMASVLYGHFRSEHLLVHHVHVGTTRDAVTALYGEGFWRFFLRVLPGSLKSAWQAEAARQTRRGKSVWHLSNPFWGYGGMQAGFLAFAFGLGGWTGLWMYAVHAIVAIWQLELVNYVEHYGLSRRKGPDGRHEPVAPHHSWNADYRASNWLLINLQRHSDHHCQPGRRYPLLQTYAESEAPLLPAGYPIMTALAVVPPVYRRVMNPRVRAWRRRFYPDVTDWNQKPN